MRSKHGYGSFSFGMLILVLVLGCDGGGKTSSGPVRTWEQWQAIHSGPVTSLVAEGAGALRLVAYLGAGDRVVAVEQMEKEGSVPALYRLAWPEWQSLPVFGEGHGRDHVEALLALNPKPEVIIRVDRPGTGIDPIRLQKRTGIPVVVVPYGNLGNEQTELFSSLRLMGRILDRTDRAEEVISFFQREIDDLRRRVSDVPEESCPSVFLGGLSWRGAHGFCSTSGIFPPFDWLRAKNAAKNVLRDGIPAEQATISPEQLLAWNPDYLFLDLGTLSAGDASGWNEIRNSSLYRQLDAVRNGRVFPLIPNTSYNINYDAMLANAWYIGSVLYPDRFADIDIRQKTDETSRFLLGRSLGDQVDRLCGNLLFRPLPIESSDGRKEE